MISTNPVVKNALNRKAKSAVCNMSELELSVIYAERLQDELRDVARIGNGRMTSSNTVAFPTENDAEDAMEYLIRYAHVPKGEVWINSKINNSAPVSTNPAVRNALNRKAKNGAYADFGLFNDYRKFAAAQLAAMAHPFAQTAGSLKRQAETSKRGTAKQSEKELIDECLAKCLAAIKDASARIDAQKANVMA